MALSVKFSQKQRAAAESAADITFFGGGNGPGKTFTGMMIPLFPEYRNTPNCESVLFAENCSKLEQAGGLVAKCVKFYSQAHPAGKEGYRQSSPRRWTFPCPGGGHSTIDLSFIGEPGKWDGMEAAYIFIDQIEQATEEQAFSVFGRNRSTSGARCRIFATANPHPLGREHWLTRLLHRGGWVGEDGFPVQAMSGVLRYYTRHPDTDEFIFADTAAELEATGLLPVDADGVTPIAPSSITFFPALIDDHPDPVFRREYKRKLASLTMFERRRRLEGNWFVTEEAGKYFNAAMFPKVDYAPSRFAQRVRSWDHAWSMADKADWTPGVLESLEPDGGLYIQDEVRFRGTISHVERAVELIAELDGPGVTIRLPKDAGLAGFEQSALAMRLGARGYHVVLTQDRGDKLTRSKAYQGCAERGQVRLANSHNSAQVAQKLLDDFELVDKHGQPVRIQGLDRSNVSTLNGWHESFIADHVRFGRDTVAKRMVKKDSVDAAVGGYSVLVEGRCVPLPDDLDRNGRAHLEGIMRVVDDALGGGGGLGV
ncbi:MAG TPA: terminase family protein [Burkholderiaceae bacterium]|uniref:terminase large subunit domain-containing protein n=1 Tax=Accumulibacter sp. TaxID=2053492 RepID=UPI002CC4C28C|nr:terminase family protein [Accumulibacter sp.]HMW22545.1 terminase family protein [Burkholderiaceae bacterium]HMW80294.1 terminase family protein [Accumulibacter sp.]HMY98032.1 terminase family protein [Burkholderiaceae bacterium]HNG77979.1 terminase family protein [Burkholderiaceae bacterium]